MRITSGLVSARLLVSAVVLSCTTLFLAVGCGGDSNGGGSPSGGSGGDIGDSGSGGDEPGGAGKGGKGGAGGKAGAPNGGGGEAGDIGAGGEGGSNETPAQNNSAVSFVTAGVVSKSKNFVLISGLGESLGGTVGSKRSKSLKYTYIPGVIAASTAK